MYFCYCFHLECQVRNDKIKTIFSVLNCLSNAGAGARALFTLRSSKWTQARAEQKLRPARRSAALSISRSRSQANPPNKRQPELRKKLRTYSDAPLLPKQLQVKLNSNENVMEGKQLQKGHNFQ